MSWFRILQSYVSDYGIGCYNETGIIRFFSKSLRIAIEMALRGLRINWTKDTQD